MHSILDIDELVEDGAIEDDTDLIIPFSSEEIRAAFGGSRPTRAKFKAAYRAKSAELPPFYRGTGRYAVLYDEGGDPTEVAFWGITGD